MSVRDGRVSRYVKLTEAEDYIAVLELVESNAITPRLYHHLASIPVGRALRVTADIKEPFINYSLVRDDEHMVTLLGVFQGLGRLRRASHFRSWIYGIAYRKCADYFRRKKIYTPLESSSWQEPWEGETIDDQILRVEQSRVLKAAMNKLPARVRSALDLYFQEGLSYREIAAVLCVPLNTVKTLIFNGKQKLRTELEDKI